MTLAGRILASLRRLFAAALWFAAAPRDWDPDLEEFEVRMEDGYFVQRPAGEALKGRNHDVRK